MRKLFMAGNWKMHMTESEALNFVKQVKPLVADVTDKDMLICPPFPVLSRMQDALKDSNVALGAQNMHFEEKGAFTGEVSGPMLKAVGCEYVIIGHSERRQYFGETNEIVNKKLKAALNHDLLPIVCVGESLEQRENNETMKVIEAQIRESFKDLITADFKGTGADLAINDWSQITIAYEPVWAIGTGKTASPEQAQEVHAFIRSLLPKEVAQKVRILYGGSVKPDNVKELMAKPDIDGGLVGGASLKPESFAGLCVFD
ncbi:triose-phosphate isomerase [Candidatus Saganbacteria bacterium CG08_land_8_20_14_0_20_45_16]|uniref:Triosephosphate isomerase n=1 Tax=Candidatus Saganbacteria bacterium CG08_land_8_20_14_0_20_45_16 TaxID=2014293 RepID=A0A2H0Y0K8_UNCSA|nr:MAG: triose-phosphate isomerase [Candidatus Saganbacteria bacterium CG08_land_8_20_14_0_20_45_16]